MARDPVCECNEIHSEAVEKSRSAMPGDEEIAALSDFFKILGDPTRMRILWALDGAELCVCDLAVELNMTKSAISHQLNTLRTAKLVKYRRDGKNVYYSLDDEHVNQIIEIALGHIAHQ
jgi:ArsR family transcriptional regulator